MRRRRERRERCERVHHGCELHARASRWWPSSPWRRAARGCSRRDVAPVAPLALGASAPAPAPTRREPRDAEARRRRHDIEQPSRVVMIAARGRCGAVHPPARARHRERLRREEDGRSDREHGTHDQAQYGEKRCRVRGGALQLWKKDGFEQYGGFEKLRAKVLMKHAHVFETLCAPLMTQARALRTAHRRARRPCVAARRPSRCGALAPVLTTLRRASFAGKIRRELDELP